MEERIGEVAGYVWDYLDYAGEASVTQIYRAIDVPQTKVNMAIGYLTSEGQIEFEPQDRGHLVRLAE